MTDPDAEAGAIENRLSLNPNDPQNSAVKDWQDGQRYNVSGEVEQISPGEFKVLSITGERSAESPPVPPEEEEMPPSSGGDRYPNPAVSRLMGE